MPTPPPFIVILAVVVGALVGLTLFTLLPEGRQPRHADGAFHKRSATRLWFALLSALVGLIGGVSVFLAPSWWQLMASRGLSALLLVLGGTAALVVVGLVAPRKYRTPIPFPLWRHTHRVAVLFVLAGVPLGMALSGMVLVALRARALVAGDASVPADLAEMLRLRQQLLTCLGASALIIAVAIIATAALRRALLAHFEAEGRTDLTALFPASHTVLYGVFFSALLAIVFVPSYLDFQTSGSLVADRSLAEAGLAAPSEEWFTRRALIVDLLSLDVGWSGLLAGAFAVLTPLASSYLTRLVGLDEE